MRATSHDLTDTSTVLGEFRRHWPGLLGSTIGIAVGIGVLPTYTIGLLIPELKAEFGWSLTALSSLPLIGSLIIIVTSPFVGHLIDRFGVRIPAVLSLAIMGCAHFALAASGASFAWYVVLYSGMFLLAAASTAVSFTRTINERFDRARGTALGIALSGAGLVGFLVPQIIGPVIADDWRAGLRTLGVVLLVCAVAVLVLIPREKIRPTPAHHRDVIVQEPIRNLLTQGLFFRLALAFLTLALAAGGMTIHLFPFLREAGVPVADAARTVSLIGIAVIASRIFVGLLIDRFFAPKVAALVLVVSAVGYLALFAGGPAFAALAAIGLGIAAGAEVDIIGNLTSRYYGIARYGRIFGVFYAAFFLGFGASSILTAFLRELTGSYAVPLLLSVALLAVSGVLLFTAPAFPTDHDSADDATPAYPVAHGASRTARTNATGSGSGRPIE